MAILGLSLFLSGSWCMADEQCCSAGDAPLCSCDCHTADASAHAAATHFVTSATRHVPAAPARLPGEQPVDIFRPPSA